MWEPNPSVRFISVVKNFGTEPERSVYFGWENFLELNPNVRFISVAKENRFEKENNFDNKINEFGKIIHKIYNQKKKKKLPLSDKRRSDDTTEPERSVNFGTPEQDPNPSVRFISAYMRPEPERSVYFASNFWS